MNIEEAKEQIKGILEFAPLGDEDVEAIETILTEYEKQQNRINEAVEYIQQGDWHDNDVYLGEDLLEILKGE